jgi:hypothetical protein
MKISANFYLGKVFINCISLKTISHVYPAVFPALSRRQLWLSSVCFGYHLGHEQAVCKMGAQNVDGRPEACQIWKL